MAFGIGKEPIEHLSQFRALPNFYVWRPADGNENVVAWQTALEMKHSPSAFVCSRQNLSLLPAAVKGSAAQGGYLLSESADATITLMASGSEVELAMQTAEALAAKGVVANVASVPCFDLFVEQDAAYVESIVKPGTKRVAIEAARGMEWYRIADVVVGMESFGASAPAGQLFDKFGFTVDNVLSHTL